MKCPYCIKICTKCHRILVANSMNFAKEKKNKFGVRSKCKECTKKYNSEHKQHKSEYDKHHYQNNKEYILEHQKKYNSEHKEHIAEYNKQWREANPEYNKQWRANNKQHIAEYNKQWAQENRELVLKAVHKRRAKLKSNGGSYTLEQWNECLEFFDYKCAYSGVELNKDNTNVEHIIPISKGGTNNITNIVPALDTVNKSKNASDMLEWYKEQPYYSEERLNKILDWLEYATKKYEL